LKEKVKKLKKFEIKETYNVDHFAAFGITVTVVVEISLTIFVII